MRVELNLCSNVLRMPVPVAVCQAERNVDEERREERGGEEGDRDRSGREKDRARVLFTRVPLGCKIPFSVAFKRGTTSKLFNRNRRGLFFSLELAKPGAPRNSLDNATPETERLKDYTFTR